MYLWEAIQSKWWHNSILILFFHPISPQTLFIINIHDILCPKGWLNIIFIIENIIWRLHISKDLLIQLQDYWFINSSKIYFYWLSLKDQTPKFLCSPTSHQSSKVGEDALGVPTLRNEFVLGDLWGKSNPALLESAGLYCKRSSLMIYILDR